MTAYTTFQMKLLHTSLISSYPTINLKYMDKKPKELEMIVIMEDIYDQIMRHNVVEFSFMSNKRLKTTRKAFTFNYLYIDKKQYIYDDKRLYTFQENSKR